MNKDQLISLLIQDLVNEYQHMLFYLWASTVVTGPHRAEFAEFFHDAAKSEMNHVREFQNAVMGLGYTPHSLGTLCGSIESTPVWGDYTPTALLKEAIRLENYVVERYLQRINDATSFGGVDGKYLEVFLENHLLDSRNDAIDMTEMLKQQ